MSEQEEKATPPVRRQGRSPSYPGIDLEKAVSRASEIWQKEKQYPTSIDVVVRHWKYKALNGPAALTLAALKKFGLLSIEDGKGGQRVKITDLTVRLLSHPDEKVRQDALREAALNPPIHKEFWNQYGTKLPSPEKLKWDLVQEKHFTERGAKEFIDEYQNTIAFAKLSESPDSETQNEFEEIDDESSRDGGGSAPQRRRPLRNSRMIANSRVIDIPLPDGASVIIEGQFPLDEQQWDQFLAILTVMKPGLVGKPETRNASGSDIFQNLFGRTTS